MPHLIVLCRSGTTLSSTFYGFANKLAMRPCEFIRCINYRFPIEANHRRREVVFVLYLGVLSSLGFQTFARELLVSVTKRRVFVWPCGLPSASAAAYSTIQFLRKIILCFKYNTIFLWFLKKFLSIGRYSTCYYMGHPKSPRTVFVEIAN